MLLQKFQKRGQRGFTLVELLIVVAIIGVLSTVGIPSFRRMIQKSKKSEAKVNLGGLYTSEAAFFAEYNSYGNNLAKMGFTIDGSSANLIYAVGFPADDCTTRTTINPTTTGSATLYNAINAAFPAYYTAATMNSRMGYTGANKCRPASGLPTGTPTFDSSADGASYTAVASGVIASGIDRAAPTDGQLDVWTMNNDRVLANIQDGVL